MTTENMDMTIDDSTFAARLTSINPLKTDAQLQALPKKKQVFKKQEISKEEIKVVEVMITSTLQSSYTRGRKMCIYAMHGLACTHNKRKPGSCFYAHSEQELNLLDCSWGYRCQNDKCSYIHPEESKTEFIERMKTITPPPLVQEEQPKQKTKMCKYIVSKTKCPHKNKCSFAHTKEELVVPKCRYGNRCNNQKCTFGH